MRGGCTFQEYRVSILFNVVEGFGLLQRPPQTPSVFDVAAVAADAGVEDVLQGVFAEEQVAEHPHTPSHGARPQSPQFSYRVYLAFLRSQITDEFLAIEPITLDKGFEFLSVFLDKRDYPFAEVFWNVFGLVPAFVHHLPFALLLLLRHTWVVGRGE